MGNPLGIESPTLHICAAVACTLYEGAQRISRKFFPDNNMTTMVIIGCTCGLSAAFNTPFGGILYAMEEYRQVLSGSNVLTTAITIASLLSVVFSRIAYKVMSTQSVYQNHTLFEMLGIHISDHPFFESDLPDGGKDLKWWMILSIPVGVACGMYTHFLSWLILKLRALIRS